MKKSYYVYFISDGNGHVKIGVTESISRRMKELQTGNARTLTLLHTVVYNHMEDAYGLEAVLHKYFRRNRVNGEWFDYNAVMNLLNHNVVSVGGYEFKGLGYPILKLMIASLIGVVVAVCLSFVK